MASSGPRRPDRRRDDANCGDSDEEDEESSDDGEEGSDDSDSDGDDFDWESADFAKIKTKVTRRIRRGKAPFPKKKEFRRPRQGKMNKKQNDDKTTCFICGKHGHWAKECPKQKADKTKRNAQVAIEESASFIYADAMRTEDGEINMMVDSGCSRNLMCKKDLPDVHQLRRLTTPITYRTANGKIDCNEEALFKAQIKDKQGRLHDYEHQTCVVDHECQPLLSLSVADKFQTDMNYAHLVIDGHTIPLQKNKKGMWSLPLFPY